MKNWLLIVAFAISGSVASKPQYLDCYVLTHEKNKASFTVMVDESTSSITHISNGNQFKSEGFFSPKSISYDDVKLVAGMLMNNNFMIDRLNLSVTQTFTMTAKDPAIAAQMEPATVVQKGLCKIANTSQQKI